MEKSPYLPFIAALRAKHPKYGYRRLTAAMKLIYPAISERCVRELMKEC